MTSIVYNSKSGSTKMYAESLGSRTGLKVFEAGSQPDDDQIVFFGWLRGNSVVGLSNVDHSKLIALCVVGLDSESRFNKAVIAEKNGVKVPVYYLRGHIIRSKLNILDKTVLLIVSVFMKLQGLNEYNKPVFDAMMEGGSFYDEKYLDPIELFLNTRS